MAHQNIHGVTVKAVAPFSFLTAHSHGGKGAHGSPLPDAVGRILARDLVADRDIPPFPRAAMDGYAVVWTGAERERAYRVIGTVNPGSVWDGLPEESDCVKIMTGAMVPPPFDTVIQVERSRVEPDGGIRFDGPGKRGGKHARQGEDVRKNSVLIPAGALLSPPPVATPASVGP